VDTLLLLLHTETACRRGGALALRPRDLDPDRCLVLLREKGETARWQPVSPALMGRLGDGELDRVGRWPPSLSMVMVMRSAATALHGTVHSTTKAIYLR
jgi:integrase